MQKFSSGCYFQNAISGLHKNLDFTNLFCREMMRYSVGKKKKMEKLKNFSESVERSGGNYIFYFLNLDGENM